MRFIYLIAFVLFTAFCIIFGVSNRDMVPFSLHPLPFSGELPLYLLLFIGIFIGLGAGSLVVMAKSMKQIQQNRKQTKKIRELEQKVQDLTPASPTDE